MVAWSLLFLYCPVNKNFVDPHVYSFGPGKYLLRRLQMATVAGSQGQRTIVLLVLVFRTADFEITKQFKNQNREYYYKIIIHTNNI